MKINLPTTVLLVPDFRYGEGDGKKELEKWLGQLCRSLEDYFKKAYWDISMGTSTFKVFSAEPTLNDLSEGQIGLSEGFLFTVQDGVMYRVKMTAINHKDLLCRVTVS